MISRTSAVAVTTLAVVSLAVAAHAVQDTYKFAGAYLVSGQNPDGESGYEGEANITQTGETYQVEWYLDDQVIVGTGIGYGDVLAVGYPGGTAVYQLADDGVLYGVWAITEGQNLGAEVLTPILGE